jgi:hypothetical protein
MTQKQQKTRKHSLSTAPLGPDNDVLWTGWPDISIWLARFWPWLAGFDISIIEQHVRTLIRAFQARTAKADKVLSMMIWEGEVLIVGERGQAIPPLFASCNLALNASFRAQNGT